jgi:cytidylate kinase
VLVAHAASYALADRDDVLRVLVTASAQTRSERVAESEDIDPRKAAKKVAESDKGRTVYLQRFYSVKHEQQTDYDLVLNTDRLTTETAARAIAAIVTS